MANIPNPLHVLLAVSNVSSLLPSVLVLVLVLVLIFLLLTNLSILVAVRRIPSTSQDTKVVHSDASLQHGVDAPHIAIGAPAEDLDCDYVADTKTPLDAGDPSPHSPTTAPAVDSDSERVQVLEARLDFLRDSCRIMFAQKKDLLAQKDDLLAQQSLDLAGLKIQLAATLQMKNDLLAEKNASCRVILAQKNEEVASTNSQLAAAQHNVATVTNERDGALARAETIAKELQKTRADYDDKIASLTIRAIDAESNSATLQSTVEQQKTEISDILLKNNNLSGELTKIRDLYDSDLERFRIQEDNDTRTIAQQGVEIAMLTQRLEAATRQRPTPASPRYSLQSIMYRRNSESESGSDSSFDSEKPSPPRWRRFTIRLPRKSGKL